MFLLRPKKNGGPNAKFFESPETINLLDAVRTWLLENSEKHVQAEPLTNKSLVALILQLIQFQEDNLGKNASKPTPLTRLPMKCFLDFRPGGALCHILRSVYTFKCERSWNQFDFQSPTKMDSNIEMFMNVETALIQNKCLVQPNVFIRPDVDNATRKNVEDIVKRHQGSITEKEEDATHIIFPSVDPSDDEDVRPIFRNKRKWTLLHWYYYPDSYDSWEKVDEQLDIPDALPAYNSNSKWKVSATWVQGLEEYNEWMSEEDYEVDDQGRMKNHEVAQLQNSISMLKKRLEARMNTEKELRADLKAKEEIITNLESSMFDRDYRIATLKLKIADSSLVAQLFLFKYNFEYFVTNYLSELLPHERPINTLENDHLRTALESFFSNAVSKKKNVEKMSVKMLNRLSEGDKYLKEKEFISSVLTLNDKCSYLMEESVMLYFVSHLSSEEEATIKIIDECMLVRRSKIKTSF